METWHQESKENLVDAIEEGKIVKVSQEYALREHLPIIRKPNIETLPLPKKNKSLLPFEELRKPLNYNKSQVITELVDNFHWQIAKERRSIGMSRKSLGESINESEETLKLIENGILPKDDFVIINKIQSFLHINLRKDKQDISKSPRSLLKEVKVKPDKTSPSEAVSDLTGRDIEIIED